MKLIFTFAGIVLNSLSSILSYNNFNVDQMFGENLEEIMRRKFDGLTQEERKRTEENQRKEKHQKTFLKQLAYFIIMVSLYLW